VREQKGGGKALRKKRRNKSLLCPETKGRKVLMRQLVWDTSMKRAQQVSPFFPFVKGKGKKMTVAEKEEEGTIIY